jgi:hypothetical protein
MPLPVRPPFAVTLAVTLVTLAGVGPSRAVAGCGDYVTYTDPADAGRHSIPTDRAPGPGKCHGPHCSEAPPPPAAPGSPTKVRPSNDDRAVEVRGPAVAEPSNPFPADPSNERPVRRTSDVFHPPR